MPDVVPHQRGSGKRRVVPISELAEALAADPAPDPAAWKADLAAQDEIFGPDEPIDPFDRDRR